ncbi:MAG: hypothetical protein QOE59_366, partial [Actinomycetota bacterium]|nr:hypothetical protein [Actinomycetota bacterium]
MRAGRGIRTAAVLTVGLVGLAVIAPGIASAATTPSALVCEAGQMPDPTGTSCVSASGSESGSGGSPTGGSTTTGSSTQESTTTAPSTSGQSTTTGGGSGSSGS